MLLASISDQYNKREEEGVKNKFEDGRAITVEGIKKEMNSECRWWGKVS